MDQPGHDCDEHRQVRRVRVVHADAEISGDVEADDDAVEQQDQSRSDAAEEDRILAVGAQPYDGAD